MFIILLQTHNLKRRNTSALIKSCQVGARYTSCQLRLHFPGQHTRSPFMQLSKNHWRTDYWELFSLFLETQALLAVSAQARTWAKYLLGIVIMNITTTSVSFPHRVFHYHIISHVLGNHGITLFHKIRKHHCVLCCKALSRVIMCKRSNNLLQN